VDADYCLRARRAEWAVSVAANARLLHPRGRKRPVRFLGRTWWPAFMPPLRLYCLFRNRMLLFRRHAWREPHWAAFEIAYALKVMAEVVFLEDGKLAKLGACFRGTGAGILGRRGIVGPGGWPSPDRQA
jgi:rhamnosyltransferase